MSQEKAFNLFDFGLKKAGKIQLFDENSLDSEGNIIPFETQVAIVSHYLQNEDTVFGETFREKAHQFVQLWLNWIRDNQQQSTIEQSIVADLSALETYIFNDVYNPVFRAVENPTFTFVDLFAGMGGFRLAMQAQGGKCVFSSEWNKYAQKTYFVNFGEVPFGDITKESTKQYIPQQFDILCAGFPCQPFSIAGVSKKKSLGRETGFKDKTQGTLFFDVADIISRHRPKAFYLENVKNLKTHDGGNTFRVIREAIEKLGYHFFADVFNTADFGLAQTRNRVYMFATTRDVPNGFDFTAAAIKTYFDERQARNLFVCRQHNTHDVLDVTVPQKYYLSDKLKRTILSNGSGGFVSKSDIDLLTARPLCATMHKMHRACQDNYFSQGFIDGEYDGPTTGKEAMGFAVRRLTPREAFRLQGFPEQYINNVEALGLSDSAMYKLAGNAVSVNVVCAILSYLATKLQWR